METYMQLELTLPVSPHDDYSELVEMVDESLGVKGAEEVEETGRYSIESKMRAVERVEDAAMNFEHTLQERFPDQSVAIRSTNNSDDVQHIRLLVNPPEPV